MLVGITQRNDKNKHGDWVDSLENSYIDYFSKFGMTLIPIPNDPERVEFYLQNFGIEGIIFTGGNDVDPYLYDGMNERTFGDVENIRELSVSKRRNQTEQLLLSYALLRSTLDIPIFGVCRGMQFINTYLDGGGYLVDNVTSDSVSHPSPGGIHNIEIASEFNTPLGEKSKVNSYHNFVVPKEGVSSNLRIFAEHEGIIEGLYHPNYPIAGIQWHPERDSPDTELNYKLVRAFVNKELFWKGGE